MSSADDGHRMEAEFDAARDKYYHPDLAARSQTAAARSVVQQGGAHAAGGSSCAMACGQVCAMCGQVCAMCGQVCAMCGQVCHMCGQVCHMCGQVCHMCSQVCAMCYCCGGTSSGGTQTLKIILVQEEPEVDVHADEHSTERHSRSKD